MLGLIINYFYCNILGSKTKTETYEETYRSPYCYSYVFIFFFTFTQKSPTYRFSQPNSLSVIHMLPLCTQFIPSILSTPSFEGLFILAVMD